MQGAHGPRGWHVVLLGEVPEGALEIKIFEADHTAYSRELGKVIAWRADQILHSENDLYALDLTFTWTWDTVARGFAIGFVIAVLTIVLTSLRISRLNVIAAIRDLPVSTRRARRRAPRLVGAVLLSVGVLATVFVAGVVTLISQALEV